MRSHLSETSHARELVLPFAVEAGFSEERCFDIQVAASEACANAIEHSPADSEVEFTVLLYSDRLEIHVEGRGEFELPAAAARERVHRGLGLPLMAKLSDHLSLYSGPRGGTLVALTFYRPGFRDRQEADDVTPPWIREVVEENELVAAITSAAPVGLYVLDPGLRYRWANAAYREFLEEPYRSEPLEGVFIGDAVPGSEEMGSIEILRTVCLTGEPAFFPEYEYVGFARGTTFWRWEILPLKQERPQPPWDVLVVISEVTEHVEQRRTLESASRSYQALAENSGLGLALCRTVYDSEGKAVDFEFVEVNRLHRAFTGLSPEEVVGRKVSEVIPGFPQELIDVQNRVASSGEPREEEIYEPHLSRWYRLTLYSPEPGYFVSLFTDITADKAAASEREKAEEALRSSEATFAGLIERSPFGTYAVDSQFRLAYMNARSQTGAFRNVRPLIGRPFTEAMHTLWPDDVAEDIISHFRHTLETGEPYHSPGFTSPRDDVEVVESYEWELQRLALPDGQHGVVCYYFDSTELRDAEEALRRSEARYRRIAEENERLYRQQLDIAENLQFALLNIPSELGPLRIGHLYRSATEAARIGGDFYDVFEVKDGQIAVLIGDVSGHGIEAARTATLVKDVVHAFTHQSLRTHEVLQHTNRLLLEKNLPGFVTAFLGILDQNTGRLRYSLAGHPEALLRRVAGEVERLGSGTSPLGLYPDPTWKTHQVELGANDILLLYTDGLIEARVDGQLFGEKRLESVLKRKRVSPEHLPHLLLDQVLAFSQGSLQDDVAVLALSLREIVGGTSKPPFKQEKLLD